MAVIQTCTNTVYCMYIWHRDHGNDIGCNTRVSFDVVSFSVPKNAMDRHVHLPNHQTTALATLSPPKGLSVDNNRPMCKTPLQAPSYDEAKNQAHSPWLFARVFTSSMLILGVSSPSSNVPQHRHGRLPIRHPYKSNSRFCLSASSHCVLRGAIPKQRVSAEERVLVRLGP